MNHAQFARELVATLRRREELLHAMATPNPWERFKTWWRLRRMLKTIDRQLRRQR